MEQKRFFLQWNIKGGVGGCGRGGAEGGGHPPSY